MNKVSYFFCTDPNVDPVAMNVYKSVEKLVELKETDIVIDNYPVMEYNPSDNKKIHFVRINDVLSHDYDKYLPLLKKHFPDDYDFIGVINWHEGAGADDSIFTVHSTGDIASGQYGVANPKHIRSLMHAIENNRTKYGLNEFQVLTEATHWSGMVYSQKPEQINDYPVPVYDIEIGSVPASWENEKAAEVLAKSMIEFFEHEQDCISILCVGGMHFTDTYSKAILNTDIPIGLSHILSNFWLEKGGYDTEAGYHMLRKAANTIQGGVQGIAFHDNMKSAIKNNCKRLAEELSIPVFKKQVLTDNVRIKEFFKW